MSTCSDCKKEKEIVGVCPKCGRSLCSDCYNLVENHWCYFCNLEDFKKFYRKTTFQGYNFLGSAILWIVGVVLFLVGVYQKNDYLPWIGIGIFFVFSFHPAWCVVKKYITGGGIIRFIIKFALSIPVCIFMLPYDVYMGIKCLHVASNGKKQMDLITTEHYKIAND